MQNVPQEELLSALIDGELSPAEAAQVRAWVAENPAAQQLLEELQSLRTSLQRLPKQALDGGFAERVLRQAERQMLTGADDAPRATISIDERPAPLQRDTANGGGRSLRPMLWAAVAMAAAVMLFTLLPGQLGPERSEVAVQDARPGGDAPQAGFDVQVAKGGAPGSGNRIPDDVLGRTSEQSLGIAAAKDSARVMGKLDTADVPGEGQLVTGDIQQLRYQQLALNKNRIKQQPAERVAVVQVELTPEAARTGQFAQVLARNAIDLAEELPAEAPVLADEAEPRAEQHDRAAGSPPAGEETPPVDVFLVEASEAQLDAMLADLTAEPKWFGNVVVADDADQLEFFHLAPTDQSAAAPTPETGAAPEVAGAPASTESAAAESPPAPDAPAAAREERPAATPKQGFALSKQVRGLARRMQQGGGRQLQELPQTSQAEAPAELTDAGQAGAAQRRVLFVLQVASQPSSAAPPGGGHPADAANMAPEQP
ncbi:MAG: zf-HC2 domain-containing protein [Pirellulales bacterium]|nr:zf-HC2 domain-containing protein [Pirellulales bacterium]